jgi:hypothetical protein
MRLPAVLTLPRWQGQVLKTSAGLAFIRALGQAAPIHDVNLGEFTMRWSFFGLVSLMGLFAAVPPVSADEDYAVLIISRERLEVPTNCEIGLYIQDQLAGRLFQEQATSFNLPAGNVSLRLKLLPGQSQGCLPGMLAPPAQNITLKAGDVRKLRIAQGPDGMYLKPAALEY